ncbi:hypothetical protein DUNSADRAFT_5866 [Dunaliella salina]|uniref:Uncharacterized protein n=1 Tax=Dunaliella salina TaxID=3046 RepID=A0ABQ7GPE8_DUNSA|nr:hypothetical protein DUNSADRAFT_5866 [Dunaliella salina]|eukprot:KAF5836480.1 hypothetical protein DUNSADRAFT_5866 [Dunaliella salina]
MYKQAGGGGGGGGGGFGGGGGRSYSTAVPYGRTYEQPQPDYDDYFSEGLFELPVVLAFELFESAQNLAPFLQETARSFSGSGTDYNNRLSDWAGGSNGGASTSSSSSVDISLPGVLDDREEEEEEEEKEKEKAEKSEKKDKAEKSEKKEKEEGDQGDKEEVQARLTNIWADFQKKKEAEGDGKNISASTLCHCSSEGKAAVCCASSRQYASKCEAECVNEDMGVCQAGPCK